VPSPSRMASAEQQNGQNGAGNVNGGTEPAVSNDEHARLREHGVDGHASLPRRALHALLSPFSATALAGLPRVKRPEKYLRADAIPQTATNEAGERPTVRDYHAINLPPTVHVPKKIATTIKVEGKIWFANERNWISWLNISILLATLAMGLFNASQDDIARDFAYFYAFISIGTLIYGYSLYQHRITMIRRRDPGHFDALAGPVFLSIALFIGILANFVIRVRDIQKKGIPIPGTEIVGYIFHMSQATSWPYSFAKQRQL